MPEGIDTPVPQSWRLGRPGDVDHSAVKDNSALLGHAGPNNGFALSLIKLESPKLNLVEHEHRHDVEVLLSEIAMRRSSNYGRAPMIGDIRFAMHLLGYDAEPTQGEEKWRPRLVSGCGHDEHRRRIIVNSIPQEIIDDSHANMHDAISGWWEKLEDLF